MYNVVCVFPLSNMLCTATENAVQLLLNHAARQQEMDDGESSVQTTVAENKKTFLLRSIIVNLRHKLDSAQSLMKSSVDGVREPCALLVQYSLEAAVQHSGEIPATMAARHTTDTNSDGTSQVGEPVASLHSLAESYASPPPSKSTRTSSSASRKAATPTITDSSSPKLTSHRPSSREPSSRAGSELGSQLSFSPTKHQLCISPPTACRLHCGNHTTDYGFEYYGPAPLVVMTPTMESSMIAMVTCIAQHSFPGVTGVKDSLKPETTREMAKVQCTCTCTCIYMYIQYCSMYNVHVHVRILLHSIHVHVHVCPPPEFDKINEKIYA